MKRFITCAALLLTSAAAQAQNNMIFYGGEGDGWNSANYIQSSNVDAFHGGEGDGWNSNGYLQSSNVVAFKGGDGDGWNNASYTQAGSTLLFKGGEGDGWNSNNYVQNIASVSFFGGEGDGWNSVNYTQNTPVVAFLGGAGDGWAGNYIIIVPLPITFLSFNARKQDKSSLLDWKMGEEKEVTSFDVERSINAVNFEKIGEVKQNDANNKEYRFTDNLPFTGNNYYRLKVKKLDGSSEYTNTRVVYFDMRQQAVIKLYPNPATEQVSVELPTDFLGLNTIVNIYSASGAIVISRKVMGNQSAVLSLNISALAAGNYYLHVAAETKTATAKFNVTGK